jgi:hypothetical protein
LVPVVEPVVEPVLVPVLLSSFDAPILNFICFFFGRY